MSDIQPYRDIERPKVIYFSGDTVRIVAENTTWTTALSEKFADSENYTKNFSYMTESEDIYTVDYYLDSNGFKTKISENVYKGHFDGFGGFKVCRWCKRSSDFV